MKIWLNGKIVDEKKALIPALDRGFLFGEGLFETMRSRRGRPMFFEEHIKRLRKGLATLAFDISYSNAVLRRAVTEILHRNRLYENDAYVRITVSRGETAGLRDFSCRKPTCMIFCRKIDMDDITAKQAKGIRLSSFAMHRTVLPDLKHTSYLPSVFALMKTSAVRQNTEPLFVTRDGEILETATSNIFLYNNAGVVTPPGDDILPGVMRAHILGLLRKRSIPVREKKIYLRDLPKYTGAFVTNSIIELLPVCSIDKKSFSIAKFLFFYTMFKKH